MMSDRSTAVAPSDFAAIPTSYFVPSSASRVTSHADGLLRFCPTHTAMSLPGHGVSRMTATGTPALVRADRVRPHPACHSAPARPVPSRREPFERSTSDSVRVPAATTSAGLSDDVRRSSTVRRQVSHSSYGRDSLRWKIVTSGAGQPDLVHDSSRHPFSVASVSSAGNQDAAWLSPISTTVVAEPVSPNAQPSAGAEPPRSRWQPLP